MMTEREGLLDANRRTLIIRATLGEIDRAREFLRQSVADFSLNEEEFFKLELALVEICVNVIRYAYADEPGEITLSLWTIPGVCLEIRDAGRPFDPRLVPAPDLEGLLSSDRRGGLGVYLARSLVDDFDYRREEGENVITLSHCLVLDPRP